MTDFYLKKVDVSDDIMADIARIVKVEPNGDIYPFNVINVDEKRQLYLIHYDENTVSESRVYEERKLRGTLVDLTSEMVVRETQGYTSSATASSKNGLEPDFNGNINITDKDDVTHNFNVNDEDTVFMSCYQGPVIFVTRTNGVTDYGTHRKINAGKSRWGQSETYLDLFRKYNGPLSSELFDETKLHSPICHMFQIVDKSLFTSSKMDFGEKDGFLLYQGYKAMYRRSEEKDETLIDILNDENLPISQYLDDDVEWLTKDKQGWISDNNPKLTSEDAIIGSNPFVDPSSEDFSLIQVDCRFNLEMANQILKYGYHPELIGTLSEDYDSRLYPGESILCFYKNDDGITSLQINSPALKWREDMIEENFNLLFRACVLHDYALLPKNDDYDTYREWFPIAGNLTGQQFHQESMKMKPYVIPPSQWEQFTPEDLFIQDSVGGKKAIDIVKKRFDNILLCFAFSLPLHLQAKVFRLKSDIKKGQAEIVNFIFNHNEAIMNNTYIVHNGKPLLVRTKKVQDILNSFKRIIKLSDDYNGYNPKKGLRTGSNNIESFRSSIYKLLNNEYGISLYHLIMFVNKKQNESSHIAISQNAGQHAAAASSSSSK